MSKKESQETAFSLKGPSVYGQLACGFDLTCLLPKETLLLDGVDFTLMIRRFVFVSVLFLTFGKVKVPCFLIQLVHKPGYQDTLKFGEAVTEHTGSPVLERQDVGPPPGRLLPG